MKINLLKIVILLTVLVLSFVVSLSSNFQSIDEISRTADRSVVDNTDTILCFTPTFNNYIKLPGKLRGYFDYKEALECAKQKGKPILVYFSKIDCIKAIKMEASILIDDEISALIMRDFLLLALWNDDILKLPLKFQEISSISGDTLKTLGDRNKYFQMKEFNQNIQPAFYIINSEKKLLTRPFYYSLSKSKFKRFLLNGKDKFSSISLKN